MLSGMMGRKVGMTQVFGAKGAAIPVTVIEAGPCTVTQVKTAGSDGYEAVQLGYGAAKLRNTPRPILGHLGHTLPQTPSQKRRQQQEQAKARQAARKQTGATETPATATQKEADEAEAASTATSKGAERAQAASARRRRGAAQALGPFALLREVDVIDGTLPTVGELITAEMFAVGERVDVIGTSKGKGFAGVMKRHGFRGGPRTHGQSDRARAPGSIGSGTTPGRVLKGTRMAGRMGTDRITIKALEIIQADPERNLLVVKGSIPGPNGGVVMIRKGADQLALAARNAPSATRA